MKSARASKWQGNNSSPGAPPSSTFIYGFSMGLASPPSEVLTFGSSSSLCPSFPISADFQLDTRSTSFFILTALVQDPILSCLDHCSSTYLVSPPPAPLPFISSISQLSF